MKNRLIPNAGAIHGSLRSLATILVLTVTLHAEKAPDLRELSGVWRTAFSADGSRLIVQMRDGGLGIWDTATGHPLGGELGNLDSKGTYETDVNGRQAIIGYKDGGARVFDLADGRAISPKLNLDISGDFGCPVVFSPDGSKIVVLEKNGRCQMIDVATGQVLAERKFALANPEQEIESRASFSRDGKRILLMDNEGVLYVLNAGSLETIGNPMKHPEAAYHIGFSSDGAGRRAVTFDSIGDCGGPANLQLWDLEETRAAGAILAGRNSMSGTFLKNGERLLVLPGRGESRVAAIPSLTTIYPLPAHDDVEASRAIPTADESALLTWGYNRQIRKIDAETGAQLGIFTFDANLQQVLAGPDVSSAWLALDNTVFMLQRQFDYYVVRLDLATMKPAALLRITDYLNQLSLSPDGSKLATWTGLSDHERIRIYDASTLKEFPVMPE